ncbi:two component transcriptional regulator, LuxR family [Glycomyces sambucus]|uniref:Two component transcriptional regulator, LuxR family n=1 Tax=Glycomyces sambucus TaxID=380244 RepID=A0A1G9FPH2_9ACTN|nr:response regulator transcription factor [Glycomyces sambucus]SDK90033.1 two component transcriptional regulator, LuxR family [Glycomyces sambucus]
MADVIRLLLVDDDALVRAGLSMMLDGVGGIVVVGEAGDGREALAAVDAHSPDVVLMDVQMPHVDGLAATRRVRARPDPPEVVMLTTFDTDENILHALRAGASGYLLKDTPPARIAEAVAKVAAGEPMLSPGVTRRLMERTVVQAGTYERARAALAVLTPREHEVAVAVGFGESNAEIAAALSMSVTTVKSHVSSILTKLGLGNRTQIALLAHDADLV